MGLDVASSFLFFWSKFFLSHVASLEAVWNIVHLQKQRNALDNIDWGCWDTGIRRNSEVRLRFPCKESASLFPIVDNQSKIKRVVWTHWASHTADSWMNLKQTILKVLMEAGENKLREESVRKLEFIICVQGVKLWTKIGSTERWHMLIEIDFLSSSMKMSWTEIVTKHRSCWMPSFCSLYAFFHLTDISPKIVWSIVWHTNMWLSLMIHF